MTAKKTKSEDVSDNNLSELSLDKLLLDGKNPRFGDLEKSASQILILDHIVEKFGVDDVLSSLAVNGYFTAEPLVCKKTSSSEEYTVVEGNRRLAACLILIGDSRASHQSKRTQQFQSIWKAHGKKSINPVPVIIFNASGKSQKEILSYLGVRHIASSQPWDSYAKANWVAKVVQENDLNLEDVALMIGDQHKTIIRLLEGFYFIEQLIETGNFRPEDSVRRGRGSVSTYPFSWVYTLLGYSSTRKYLGLSEQTPTKNPIAPKNLSRGALVVKAMFGDNSRGKSALISDSRELGDLASTFADPIKLELLAQGKSVSEIIRLSMPIDDRLREGLAQIREIQNDLINGLTESTISKKIAEPLVELARKNKRSSQEIEMKLSIAAGKDAEE